MKNLLLKLTLVPVWALTLFLKPLLPQAHPWKHQRLTLQSWCERGTQAAIECGLGLWISGFGMIFGMIYVIVFVLAHGHAAH